MTERGTARALRRLHGALLQTQRIDLERDVGRLSSGQLLQLVLVDPRFAWLNELTALAARLDAGQASVAEVSALLAEPDPDTAFGAHYLAALQDDPGVVLAHRDVLRTTTSTDERPA